MLVGGCDLGSAQLGWCVGDPDEGMPATGVVKLKEAVEGYEVACRNLACFLRDGIFLKYGLPDWFFYERPLPTNVTFKKTINTRNGPRVVDWTNINALQMPHKLEGALLGMCGAYDVPAISLDVGHVRRAFIGRVSCGSPEKTKDAVAQMAELEGLMPNGVTNRNISDAIAVWRVGALEKGLGRRRKRPLVMFGEKAQ